MRIAYITARFPFGPGERFFEPEVHALAKLGQDVILVPTRPNAGLALHEDIGLPCLRLGTAEIRTFRLALAETIRNPIGVARAAAIVTASRYRLTSKAKNVLLFAKALAVAHELRRMKVDHIHAQWLSTPSSIAYVAFLLTKIPWSCTAHQFDLFEDNLLEKKAASAQFVRAISSRTRDIIVEKAGAKAAARCAVVHLGVNLPVPVGKQRVSRSLNILCPAYLVPKKGHRYLLEALELLSARGVRFRCDLAGSGPLRAELERIITAKNLRSSVRMRGNVAHHRLCAELNSGTYDVCVLASTERRSAFEGIPVSLIEAMAAGVPCIATRTGSIPELIEDGVSSRLVPPEDAVALADALGELAANPQMRARFAQAARLRIQERFDAQRTSRALFDLMQSGSVPA